MAEGRSEIWVNLAHRYREWVCKMSDTSSGFEEVPYKTFFFNCGEQLHSGSILVIEG